MSRPLLIGLLLFVLLFFIIGRLLQLPRSGKLVWVRWHLWHCCGIHTNLLADGVQPSAQPLAYAPVVGNLGCHPVSYAMDLGFLVFNSLIQFGYGSHESEEGKLGEGPVHRKNWLRWPLVAAPV